MKTTLLSLIALATIATANAQNYTIKGTITSPCTEKWIYMEKFMGGGEGLDSAQITNNKFEFKGTTKTPEMYLVFFDKTKRETRRLGLAHLFVEPGNMEISIQPENMFYGSKTTGGTVNTEFNNLEKQLLTKYILPMDSLAKMVAQTTPELRKKYLAERDELQAALTVANLDYITKHPTSPVSLFRLSTIYYTIPFETFEAIMAKIPTHLQSSAIYKNMKLYSENVKKYREESTKK